MAEYSLDRLQPGADIGLLDRLAQAWSQPSTSNRLWSGQEELPTVEGSAAIARGLGQTWPGRVVTDTVDALKGVIDNRYVPGLRRNDVTDIPPPQAPTEDSTALGRYLGIPPVAWGGPNDAVIQPAADLAGFVMGGGFPAAERGAVGMAGGRLPSSLPMDEASRLARARQLGYDIDNPLYHGTSRDFTEFMPGGKAEKVNTVGFRPTNSLDADMGVFLTSNPKLASEYSQEAAKNWRHDTFGEFENATKQQKDAVLDLMRKEGITNQYDFRVFMERTKDGLPGETRDAVRSILGISPEYEKVYPVYVKGKYKEIDFGGKPHNDMRVYREALQAKNEGYDGLRLQNIIDSITGNETGNTMMVFDPKNIRGKFAAFDPANEGSAFLLGSGQTKQSGLGLAPELARDAQGIRTYIGPEGGRVSYRRTASATPDTGVGYMMFADNKDAIEHYGKNLWSFDHSMSPNTAVSASDSQFRRDLYRALRSMGEEEAMRALNQPATPQIAKSLVNEANPQNIVNSAGFWDNPELVSLAWEKILEPRGYTAVTTKDGAVVFDRSLVNQVK